MLTTEDLLKLQKLIKFEIKEELKGIYDALKSKADRDDLMEMKDVLTRHDNYIKSEQILIIKHLDENSIDIKKIKKNLALINSRFEIEYKL